MADDVALWLEELGLGQYAQAFADNDIDLEVLPHLREEDFERLGLSLGHIRKLQAAIETLSAETPTSRPAAHPAQEPKAQPSEAERRQLTVLFCDLLGSTALSAKLDPEDMRDVLRAYQDACLGVIDRYDGYVAKFMGDGVFAYFGYPMAHEDDAERAINAGLGIVEAVGGLEHDLRVRIGVATGTVAVGDIVGEGASEEAAIVGEAPNLAARLQEIAEPNTVVINEATHTLAGSLFETNDLGKRDLKGFAAPVGAWSVVRPRRTESRFAAIRGEQMTGLVGREEEMEILVRRWERAKVGEGQVVLISGEPGIGKSRLARELQERIADQPHYRLRYQCSPYHTNSALHPVIEQLERASRFETGDGTETKLDKLEALLSMSGQPVEHAAPLIASLLSLPTEGRYPTLNISPQQQKVLTLQALLDQLSGLAARQPVLFVLEDAHWIDPTTLELLELTVDLVPQISALLLITYRPEFEAPWIGGARVTPVILGRLDRRDSTQMVERVAHRKNILAELRDQITDRTDGVPLFIEELTKSLLESVVGSSEQIAAIEVPTTIQDSLEARLDRLGPAKQIAQIAAVIGREFSYDLVAAVVPTGVDLGYALDRLTDAELVFRRGQPPQAIYTFKHALVQETAYGTLLRSKRADLHARIAHAIEANFPEMVDLEPDLIAHHCAQAGLSERATRYSFKAAELSHRRANIREAVAHFRAALDQLSGMPDDEDRARLELTIQIRFFYALRATLGPSHPEHVAQIERAYELCRKVGTSEQLASILSALTIANIWRADIQKAVRFGEQHFELAEKSGARVARLLAHLGLGQALWHNGQNQRARSVFEKVSPFYDAGFDIAQGYGPGVFMYWSFLASTQFSLGFPDQAITTIQGLLANARELNHVHYLQNVLFQSCAIRIWRGEANEALQWTDEFLAAATEADARPFMTIARIYREWALSELGNAENAADHLQDAIDTLRAMHFEGMLSWYGQIFADLLIAESKPKDALRIVDAELERMETTHERQFQSPLLSCRADALLSLQNPDPTGAEACYLEAIQVARSQSAKSWELRAATCLARLWQFQDKTTEARDLLGPVYGWFTEGFDTADLKNAKALLQKLA